MQTLVRAAAMVGPGDTITLRVGTYAESPALRSTITVRAYSGESVTLQPVGERVLLLENKADVTLRGLILDASQVSDDGVRIDTCSGITLEDCEVFGVTAAADGTAHGILCVNSSVILNNCHVHHCGADTFDHGVYASGGSLVISGGEFDHNAGHGVHVYGGGITSTSEVIGAYCHDNTIGIGLYAGAGQAVGNSCMDNSYIGIAAEYGLVSALIQGNDCLDNGTYQVFFGQQTSDFTDIIIDLNQCQGGVYGIGLVIDEAWPGQSADVTNNSLSGHSSTAIQEIVADGFTVTKSGNLIT